MPQYDRRWRNSAFLTRQGLFDDDSLGLEERVNVLSLEEDAPRQFDIWKITRLHQFIQGPFTDAKIVHQFGLGNQFSFHLSGIISKTGEKINS
jgi:hypothetical protein